VSAAPLASVVIATRNRRHELARAIRSVQAQSIADWELVVVDDASTDETSTFLSGLDDPRIRALRLTEHAERSAARNRGLELAAAPAVLFLDDDDELTPPSLELLARALARHPAACASVGAVIHDLHGRRRRPWFPKRARLLNVRLELLAGWVALGGQSLMRTALLRELGGWREELSVAEDQELWLRLCQRGPVAIVPEAVLVHRPHGLAGDLPGGRDVERRVVSSSLAESSAPGRRARLAAAAREHLRDADISFQTDAHRAALRATVSGVLTAPFLLASPLVGPGVARGLAKAAVAAALPPGVVRRLRAERDGRRRPAARGGL